MFRLRARLSLNAGRICKTLGGTILLQPLSSSSVKWGSYTLGLFIHLFPLLLLLVIIIIAIVFAETPQLWHRSVWVQWVPWS